VDESVLIERGQKLRAPDSNVGAALLFLIIF
jgi:hypothetical protein